MILEFKTSFDSWMIIAAIALIIILKPVVSYWILSRARGGKDNGGE